VPSSTEGVDGLGELLRAIEAGPVHGLASENAEPDFDLIEPRRGCRGEVERHGERMTLIPCWFGDQDSGLRTSDGWISGRGLSASSM
jgi:hypothetical protein